MMGKWTLCVCVRRGSSGGPESEIAGNWVLSPSVAFLKWDSSFVAFWQPGFGQCGTNTHTGSSFVHLLCHFFRSGLLLQHQLLCPPAPGAEAESVRGWVREPSVLLRDETRGGKKEWVGGGVVSEAASPGLHPQLHRRIGEGPTLLLQLFNWGPG